MNNNIKNLFRKTCVNELPACDYISVNGKQKILGPRIYRREDFTRFAKEAYEKDEEYFYTEPVNPNNPNGPHKLSEPKYIYELKHSLTEEEFNKYFEQSNKLAVSTENGTIFAEISPDSKYPGIYINFQSKEINIPITTALVEYNSDEENINAYVWSNAMNEDYTYKTNIQNIDKFINYVSELDKEFDS